MSVTSMAAVFAANIPEIKTDDGKVVPDSTAKFVLLAMADNAGEYGENCYSGIRKLCQKTNMSSSTVCNAINALRTNKFVFLIGKSKADTNNYTINLDLLAVLRFQPPKQGDSSHRNSGVLATETEPSINHQIKPDILDGILEAQAITELIAEACQSFEMALFGTIVSWPWSSNAKWQKFSKWVSAQEQSQFKQYAEWRKGDGKYQAMSNNKIRQDPQSFMDTGWPTFLAYVSMYGEKIEYTRLL